MKDLTGQRFGEWTVIRFDHRKGKSYYWLCHCECGIERVVKAGALTSGRSKSCGCGRKLPDKISGKRFGSLVVVRKTDELYADGSYLYECKCDCGGIIKTTSTKLLSGRIKNCDSPIHKVGNLTGQRFGKLTVTSFSHTEKAKSYWNCQCDCGNMTVAKGNSLSSGKIVSCGCVKKENLVAGREAFKKAFVDGTNIKQIGPDRKLNSNNKTGVKGVSFIASRQKYRAQIIFKRKVINLGEFDKLEDAAEARKKGEDMYFAPVLENIDK